MTDSGVRKAYKCRLYPTPAEAERLDYWLMLCRNLYNACVEQRLTCLSLPLGRRRYINNYGPDGQQAQVSAASCGLPPEYAELPSNVKQAVTARVENTFRRWFSRRSGRPRFQSWRRYNSIIYPSPTGWSIEWDGQSRYGRLRLRRPGRDPYQGHAWEGFSVRIRIDQGRRPAGDMRTLTLSKRAGRWHAMISCRDVPARALPLTGRTIALDLRISRSFLTTSDGDRIDPPRYYQQALRQLRMRQRRVSRRQRGSTRREGAVRLLQRAHEHVANQRLDFHHKLAHDLVTRYDTIIVEDISPLFMIEKRQRADYPQLATAALDAGWSQFLTILRQKCDEYGRQYIEVPAMYTSQTCSQCGAITQPNGATFRCAHCGLVEAVDINAARNILRARLLTDEAE